MKELLNIEGMTCNHCVEKIKKFVGECEGVQNININLENKTLEVEFIEPTTIENIILAIEDSGFEVKS
ncbi:hypothetical protein CCY99_00180 [Helicobacter sp. 16-1353]|uniref:heavy-metal-associated domain-containing protein n=1 Tax=Helicobacter sp. 16-1353 TaxID=2004996 RepID=UPI000DCDA528|nr:copper ion binding protein [Helicobacter sp. 16-1353]RAX55152.1 hypothetical protein CCY99_00180 [Helicobacter sp. 16-1353]